MLNTYSDSNEFPELFSSRDSVTTTFDVVRKQKDWVSSVKYLLYMKSSFMYHIDVLNSTLHWETQ